MASGLLASATAVDRPHRAAGRPRDPNLDAAILDAALSLLDEVGYQEMSVAAVASAAGVGRPAIYRRYGSKADLVIAALLHVSAGPEPELPADPKRALRALLGMATDALTTPGAMAALGSLMAEQRRDPELLAVFRTRIFDPRREVVHRVVQQGIDSGDIAPDVDREAIDGLLFGALLARAILGEPVNSAWLDRIMDQAWRGLALIRARPGGGVRREPSDRPQPQLSDANPGGPSGPPDRAIRQSRTRLRPGTVSADKEDGHADLDEQGAGRARLAGPLSRPRRARVRPRDPGDRD